MIDHLKPYPTYKSSGAPGLGQVPAHWEVLRTRNVVDMKVSNVDKHSKEGELPVRLCNYVNVYKNGRITENLSFMRATATFEEVVRFRLEIDDVLITKDSETWNDIGIPALVEYVADDLVCGYHLALLRPRKKVLNGSYLWRALQSSVIAYHFHVGATGVTRYGLSQESIKSLVLTVPPKDEQTAIARYLDHVDRKIHHYIRAKKKLIRLLNEQNQSIIHGAVTRGLDPNARLKPSQSRWFPVLPAHWSVLPMRRVITSAIDGPHFSPNYLDNGIPFLSARNVKADGWQLKDAKYISITVAFLT